MFIKIVEWIAVIDVLAMFALIFGYRTWELIIWWRESRSRMDALQERNEFMNLDDALQETGCAIFINGDCTTSVERLTDEEYLLMTRRGVCILQCHICPLPDVERRFVHHADQQWQAGRVQFVQVYHAKHYLQTWGHLEGETIEVYDPSTKQTYRAICGPDGGPILEQK